MASVFQRPKTKYWHAGWYDAQGRFRLRSTKQTDRTKALAVATEWERAERLARDRILTQAQCRKVLNDILERTGATERLEMPTVREELTKWLETKGESTRDRYRPVINGFLEDLRERAERPVLGVSAFDVDHYVSGLQKAKHSRRTVDLHLSTLKAAFGKSLRMGVISANPAAAVELEHADAEEDMEREVFTAAEVGMLVDAAEGEWRILLLLGYYSGLRMMKCATLRWDAVNLAENRIEVRPGKRGAKVHIPLHPELRAALETAASTDEPQEYVMPALASRDSGGKRGLSRDFLAIARKAGVDLRQVVAPNGRKQFLRSFHALRHSFVSALANAGVDSELRRKLTGHRSAATHDIYTHLEHERLASAIAKLAPVSH